MVGGAQHDADMLRSLHPNAGGILPRARSSNVLASSMVREFTVVDLVAECLRAATRTDND